MQEAARACKRAITGAVPDKELAQRRQVLKCAVYLQAWLVQKTSDAATMLYVGSNRQSKAADLAVTAFKINPRDSHPMGKYPSMTKWVSEQKLNAG